MSPEQTLPPILSDQEDTHRNLERVVRRHLAHPWRKPLPDHTRRAADTLMAWLEQRQQPLVLDSFCGTGMSTAALARANPDHAVVGVDKSAARLNRNGDQGDFLLLRAECESLWRWLVEHDIRPSSHYMLYPNPWPKSIHLQRRIHGHPGFAALAALGGSIELRSNWEIYVREFAAAMGLAGFTGAIDELTVHEPLTLFEKKYHERRQRLWQWRSTRTP